MYILFQGVLRIKKDLLDIVAAMPNPYSLWWSSRCLVHVSVWASACVYACMSETLVCMCIKICWIMYKHRLWWVPIYTFLDLYVRVFIQIIENRRKQTKPVTLWFQPTLSSLDTRAYTCIYESCEARMKESCYSRRAECASCPWKASNDASFVVIMWCLPTGVTYGSKTCATRRTRQNSTSWSTSWRAASTGMRDPWLVYARMHYQPYLLHFAAHVLHTRAISRAHLPALCSSFLKQGLDMLWSAHIVALS